MAPERGTDDWDQQVHAPSRHPLGMRAWPHQADSQISLVLSVNEHEASGVCLTERWVGFAFIPAGRSEMGFLSRLLVPRGVRRAVHPVRTVKRAATPRVVKRATRAMHPLDNAVYSVERPAVTSLRSGRKRRAKARSPGRAQVYRHGSCPVAHRTPEAAAKCRNR